MKGHNVFFRENEETIWEWFLKQIYVIQKSK